MKRYKDELRETKVRTRHFSSNCLVWDVLRNKSPMTQTSLVKGVVVKLAEDKRIELSAFRLARFSRPITSIGAIFQIFWRKG